MALTKISTGMLKQDAASSDLNIDAGTLYLDVSNNRVGVGTTSPWDKFVVYGGGIHVGTAPSSNNSGRITYDTTNGALNISAHSTGGSTYTRFSTSNSGSVQERLRITHDGNVGIGESNPSTTLTVGGIVQIKESSNIAFYGANYVRMFGDQNYYFKNTSGATRAFISMADGDLNLYNSSTVLTNRISTNSNSYFNGGNVGIGTTAPSSILHVVGGSATIPTLSSSFPLTISNNGNSGLNIISSGTTNAGQINFGDSGDADAGRIRYDHNDNSMRFTTNATERMRIDSSGNVGIATTSPNQTLHVNGMSQFDNTMLFGARGSISWGTMGGGTGFGIRAASGNALSFGSNGAWDKAIIDTAGRLLINATTTAFSDQLYVNGNAYATGGWRTGTSATFVGELTNSSGKLTLQTAANRDIQIGDTNTPDIVYVDTSAQKVGIGTTSPAGSLHIDKGTSSDIIIEKDDTGGAAVRFYNTGSQQSYIQLDSSEDMVYYGVSGTDHIWYSNAEVARIKGSALLVGSSSTQASSSERFLVYSTGEQHSRFMNSSDAYTTVYIKNSSTTANTNQPFLTFQDTGGNRGNFGLRYSTSQLVIQGHGGVGIAAGSGGISQDPDLFVKSGGNVGIGRSDPTYVVDVKGTGSTLARFLSASDDALVRIIANNYSTEADARLFLGETDVYGMTVEYDGVANIGYIGMNDNVQPNLAFSKRIQMSRAGTETAFMAGNVGIGTASPSEKLHIEGSVLIDAYNLGDGHGIHFREGFGPSNAPYNISITTYNDGDGSKDALDLNGYDGIYLNTGSGTARQTRLHVTHTGNVGIGTTDPTTDVTKFGSGATGLSVAGGQPTVAVRSTANAQYVGYFGQVSTNTYLGALGGGDLLIQTGTSGTEKMRITSAGNVGIGTTSPESLLTLENDDATLRIRSATTTTKGLTLRYNNSGNFGQLLVDHQGNNQLAMKYYALTHTFGRSDSDQMMTIDSGGNVGIGITSPNVKLAVDGQLSTGGRRLSLGILDLNSSSTPTQFKIITNIPFASGAADFTVNIKGFRYGSNDMVDLSIGWHYYNSTFYNASVKSSGAWAPTVTLGVENSKVVIHLASPEYWPKMYVESMYSSAYRDSYAAGWSWADSAISSDSGTPTVSPAYSSDFGNNFKMLDNGNVGIGTGSPNSYSNQKVLTINGTTHSRIDFETADTLRGSIYGDSGSLNLDAGGNYLRFYTGNTQKMTLLANGNVGIGISSPTAKLHIVGSAIIDGGTGVASTGVLNVRQSGDTLNNGIALTSSHSTSHRIWKDSAGKLNFGPTSLPSAFVQDLTGKVGIGTTAPAQALQVNGNIRINHPDDGGSPADTAIMEMYGYEGRGVGIRLRDSVNSASGASNREWFVGTGYSTSSFGIGYSSDGSQSSYNNQNKLTVGANGDVGVGTTGPQGKLHVEVSEGNAGFVVGTTSSTSTNSRYQVITCANVLATSGTWYDVAYVTHSPTIDVLGRIIANNATSHGGAGVVYHVVGMYGSVTAHQKTYQLYNNTSTFTNFEYRYLNGGASSGSYRLQVKGTWTNASHNAYVYTTIRGMADGTMYEDD